MKKVTRSFGTIVGSMPIMMQALEGKSILGQSILTLKAAFNGRGTDFTFVHGDIQGTRLETPSLAQASLAVYGKLEHVDLFTVDNTELDGRYKEVINQGFGPIVDKHVVTEDGGAAIYFHGAAEAHATWVREDDSRAYLFEDESPGSKGDRIVVTGYHVIDGKIVGLYATTWGEDYGQGRTLFYVNIAETVMRGALTQLKTWRRMGTLNEIKVGQRASIIGMAKMITDKEGNDHTFININDGGHFKNVAYVAKAGEAPRFGELRDGLVLGQAIHFGDEVPTESRILVVDMMQTGNKPIVSKRQHEPNFPQDDYTALIALEAESLQTPPAPRAG